MSQEITAKDAWFGWLFVLAGIGSGAMIYLHPERLNAPAWVAFVACGVFVFAGLVVILQAYGNTRMSSLFAFLILVCFTTLTTWIAFGPGPRTCTSSVSGLITSSSESSGLGCRIPFGIAAALCALITIAGLLHWIRGARSD